MIPRAEASGAPSRGQGASCGWRDAGRPSHYPSHVVRLVEALLVRVTLSESYYPSHAIRVTLSESRDLVGVVEASVEGPDPVREVQLPRYLPTQQHAARSTP